jgi:hypothetical protein
MGNRDDGGMPSGAEDTLIAFAAERTLATPHHDPVGPAPRGEPTGRPSSRVTGPEAAPALPTGAARFALGTELGRGGMGRVVSAVDRQFDRVVAVKEMLPDAGRAARERFDIEARVTGTLEHPGIPSVYERGERDGVPFYAMRKIEGRTLGALLDEARTLEARLRLLPVVVQVAQTLGYAHDRGVVHRDVKPENVLVGPHGEAVVLDWGIAKVRGLGARLDVSSGTAETLASDSLAGAPTATAQGAIVGTPSYMAPEQAQGRVDAIDARTDVFQLGALLYHVLVGRPPYDGPNTMAVVSAALLVRYTPVREAAPDAPSRLAAICEKAMAREPAQRFADGNALAAALGGMMVEAVVSDERGVSRWAARGITVASMILAILATLGIQGASPTLREGGFGAYVAITFPTLALALAVLEWRTAGRFALGGLVSALAGATVLFGVAATAINVAVVLRAARTAPPAELSELLVLGLYESIAPLTLALPLAAVTLLVRAVVARAVAGSPAADRR